MEEPKNFQEQALVALQTQRVREFLNKHWSDQSLWDWLNSETVHLGLFLSIGQAIEGDENKLTAARRLIAWQYRVALAVDKAEPRPSEMTKLDEIRLQTALHEPTKEVVLDATRYVLIAAKPQELVYDSQRAVLFYYLIEAAHFSELTDVVIGIMSNHSELFRDQALLSVVILAYGATLVELLSNAAIRSQDKSAVVARVLQRVTGRTRGEQPPKDYANDTLKWYGETKERLVVNYDALYPAPPFEPLLKVEGVCPTCDSQNPPGSRFCNHCGNKLIS